MADTAVRPRSRSRGLVLEYLRVAREPRSVADVVAATGLSANAVRFHLDRLTRSGSVHVEAEPPQGRPGRPALRYSALPQEAVDPASAYRVLAGLMARELARTGSPDAPTQAGRAWAGRVLPELVAGDGTAADAADSQDPSDLLLLLFSRTGFRPTRTADRRTLHLHQCPFWELAVEQPGMVCAVHLGLVRGVLEAVGSDDRAELTPVLDGSGPCVLGLRRPTRTPVGTSRPRPRRPARPAGPGRPGVTP